MGLLRTLRFIAGHPLNRSAPLRAVTRFIRWQLACRLFPGLVVIPFVGDARLLVGPGMTGATGNLYCGLHEFEDMSLVLHGLRSGDLFVDVGANVGAYAVLASASVDARTIAIEPAPRAYRVLNDNIRLNDISDRVTTHNVGIGREPGRLRFTDDLDTVNHVVVDGEIVNSCIVVEIHPLDALLGDVSPVMLKIDVEGYEAEVLAGAELTLARSSLLAILIETNCSGQRYGHTDEEIERSLCRYGFEPFRYDPLSRRLERRVASRSQLNTLYVREPEQLQNRLLMARRFKVNGIML